jgi:DNA helicase-2/ATP-dependent DNA helicase PcrA
MVDMACSFSSPVGYRPAATRPEHKSGGAAPGRVMHAKQVRKPNPPRPSTPKPAAQKAPKAPEHDEFSQDTVQYRMGQYVSHAKYGRGKILSISGFGPDMRLTVLFGNGNRKKMLAKFANLEAL